MATIVFVESGCSMPNGAKSANSLGSAVFFPLLSCMWLSFGGAKSQIEFVAPEFVEATLHVMVAENCDTRRMAEGGVRSTLQKTNATRNNGTQKTNEKNQIS